MELLWAFVPSAVIGAIIIAVNALKIIEPPPAFLPIRLIPMHTDWSGIEIEFDALDYELLANEYERTRAYTAAEYLAALNYGSAE